MSSRRPFLQLEIGAPSDQACACCAEMAERASRLAAGRAHAGGSGCCAQHEPPSGDRGESYDPGLAARELGSSFVSRRRGAPLLRDSVASLMEISARLIENIPDAAPSEREPKAIRNLMLSRLRQLLGDPDARMRAQQILDEGLHDPEETGWGRWGKGGKGGKWAQLEGEGSGIEDAMELLVLTSRAGEHFLPHSLDTPETNAARARAWHHAPAPGADPSSQPHDAGALEPEWFHRAAEEIRARVFAGLPRLVALSRDHRDCVLRVLAASTRTRDDPAWSGRVVSVDLVGAS